MLTNYVNLYHFSIVGIIYRFLFPNFSLFPATKETVGFSFIFFSVFRFIYDKQFLHTFLFVVNNYILMLTISFSHFSFRPFVSYFISRYCFIMITKEVHFMHFLPHDIITVIAVVSNGAGYVVCQDLRLFLYLFLHSVLSRYA